MSRKRSETPPRSACPINHAVELLGDQWTLLILRELIFRHRRTSSELSEMEEGIASNILRDRLVHLQDAGLLVGSPDPDDGRRTFYELTDSGRRVAPILLEFMVWSWHHSADVDIAADLVSSIEADRVGAASQVLAELDASRPD